MAKEISLIIGKEECTAELLVDEAPTLCRLIEDALPLQGVLGHGKLVDNEVFFQVPFMVDDLENLKWPEAGELTFGSSGPSVCIFYEDMVAFWPLCTFGRITSNYEGFQREAAQVWENPGTRITLKAKEA